MGRNVIGEEAKQEDSIECPKCSTKISRAEFDDHFFAHQFEEEVESSVDLDLPANVAPNITSS